MKKLILTVATFILVATHGNAQTEVGANFGLLHLPITKTTTNLVWC